MSSCPTNSCTNANIILTCGALSVTLRRPSEDSRSLKTNMISVKTRGKQSVHIGGFPSIETLDFKFKNLNITKLEEFFVFYEASAGLEITLTDYCNVNWIGVILNESIPSKNYGAGLGCSTNVSERLVWDLEFKFEGVKQ